MGLLYQADEWFSVGSVEDENGPICPNKALWSQIGFLLTRTEFESMVKEVSAFYDIHDDMDIKNYNHWVYHVREQARIKKRETKEPVCRRPSDGYVYLLFLRCSGHYKIGLSNNPERRVWKEISPVLPEEPELICTIGTEDMHRLEAQLHMRFANKRAKGEWFRLDANDVEYIKGLADGTS